MFSTEIDFLKKDVSIDKQKYNVVLESANQHQVIFVMEKSTYVKVRVFIRLPTTKDELIRPIHVEIRSNVLLPELVEHLQQKLNNLLLTYVSSSPIENQNQVLETYRIMKSFILESQLISCWKEIQDLQNYVEEVNSNDKVSIKLQFLDVEGIILAKLKSHGYFVKVKLSIDETYPKNSPDVEILKCNVFPRFQTMWLAQLKVIGQLLEKGINTSSKLLKLEPVTKDTNLKEKLNAQLVRQKEEADKKIVNVTAQQRIKAAKERERQLMEGKMTALKLRLRARERMWKEKFEQDASTAKNLGATKALPSLYFFIVILWEVFINRLVHEHCVISHKKLFPVNPKQLVDYPEKHKKRIEKLPCGHYCFFGLLSKYIQTPPFHQHKQCPICGKRLSHRKIDDNLTTLAATHAHRLAKARELNDVQDFMGNLN